MFFESRKDAIKELVKICKNKHFSQTIDNIKEEDNSIISFKRIKNNFLKKK